MVIRYDKDGTTVMYPFPGHILDAPQCEGYAYGFAPPNHPVPAIPCTAYILDWCVCIETWDDDIAIYC